MTTDTTGRYAPMPEPVDVRASGGIVHGDGNVFFTNIEKMESLFRAYADATCALREAKVDRNMAGAAELITRIIANQPIWPNEWGQDVAMAAFILTARDAQWKGGV